MKIERYDTVDLVQKAAEKISELVARHSESPLLFMVSGGSAMKLLNYVQILEDQYPNILLTVLDERYTFEDDESNFFALTQTGFYKQAVENDASTFDPRPKEGESLEACAKRFNAVLKEWMRENADGQIIITQGMGADGHTAGIFPDGDKEAFDTRFVTTQNLAVGYEIAPKVNQYTKRITVTIPFLKNHVDHPIIYVQGEGKRDALASALTEESEIHSVPAAVVREMKSVTLFTDIEM